ncbi:Endo-1,4-beta-xylanase [Colletotrichum sidae]|uniref:Beta-xylanase n=1 Tax=Colletotrichum sidae TaxID=1347389 RepID=A0A4R8TPT5_9PEZI|nr:Endo-1,4-beta-xylanase [Colletotrichum sidae]
MKLSLLALLAPLAAASPIAPAAAGAADRSLEARTDYGAHKSNVSASVDKLFKRRGKLYFGASGDNGIMQQGKTEAVFEANFGQVTPEYSMKWDQTEPSRGNFSWGNSDWIVDWALSNKKSVHGHTLIWHTALPAWVSAVRDKATLTEVIQTHIKAVVGRYKGKIRSWDVVNEIFNDDGTFRNTTFYNVLGESYVGIAFRAAREADPSAKLFINDYNLDNKDWGKPAAVVKKVNQWIAQGVPIDGIGSQCHLVPGMGKDIQGALEVLATAKVSEILVTELDVDTAPPEDYTAVVEACVNVSKCKGITVWGISDKQSWKAEKEPLLFDADYNPKPAYTAITKSLTTY